MTLACSRQKASGDLCLALPSGFFPLIKQKVWETKESNPKHSPVRWSLISACMKYFLMWVKTEANNLPFYLFFLFLLKNICLGAAVGLLCCTQDSSSCGQWGLLCSCGAWASCCGGFSCAAWTPEHSRSAACGIFPDQGLHICPLHWQADS